MPTPDDRPSLLRVTDEALRLRRLGLRTRMADLSRIRRFLGNLCEAHSRDEDRASRWQQAR